MNERDPKLQPAEPEDVGVPDETPEAMNVEGAKKLAIEARPRLHEQGFDDEQIDEWATTYVAEEGAAADVDQFVEWIAEREH